MLNSCLPLTQLRWCSMIRINSDDVWDHFSMRYVNCMWHGDQYSWLCGKHRRVCSVPWEAITELWRPDVGVWWQIDRINDLINELMDIGTSSELFHKPSNLRTYISRYICLGTTTFPPFTEVLAIKLLKDKPCRHKHNGCSTHPWNLISLDWDTRSFFR